MKRGRSLTLIVIATLVGMGAYVAVVGVPAGWRIGGREPGRIWQVDMSPLAAVQREEFDAWLAAEPDRAREFSDFETFIAREGFADLLPAWTLLRANANKSERCNVDPFVLPPRALWPNILPALQLVRDKVIPAIGPVAVASAFRDPTLNACSRGATQSRHLTFHALDLVPVMQPPAPEHFAKLCTVWRTAGRGSRWGLGAYHDPAKPEQNTIGRFHVDGTGWRTWGFSYGRASSACDAR